jgi:hypothetical protein
MMTTSSKAAIDRAPAKNRNFHYRCAARENDGLPETERFARICEREICECAAGARIECETDRLSIVQRDYFSSAIEFCS